MNKHVALFILIYLGFGIGNAQESHIISWSGVKTVSYNDSVFNVLDFDNSLYDSTISLNSIYFHKIPINNNNVELSISNIIYADLLDSELDKVITQELTENVQYNYHISTEKKQYYLIFYLIPFIKRGDSIKKVSSFDIQIHQNKIVRLSQKKNQSITLF